MSHKIKRKIEWADRRDHANRTANPKSKIAFSGRNGIQRKGFTVQTLGFFRGNGECADGAIHFGARELESLASFGSNGFCKILRTFAQQRRGLEKNLSAL